MPTNNINRGAINEDVTWSTGGWSPGQDIQQDQVNAYRDLWNNRQPLTWGDNVVQPWNGAQQGGYNAMLANTQGWDSGAVRDFYNNTMGTGAGVDPRYQQVARQGTSWGDPAMGGFQQLAAAGMGQQGLQYAQDFASGKYMGQNPYLQATYGNAAGDVTKSFREGVMPSIEGRAALAGRGGSNAEMMMGQTARQDLGNTLDRLATDIYGGAYQSDMANMYGAGMALPGLINADFARQLAGNQAYSDAAARQQGMRMDAARTGYGMGEAAWQRQASTAANLPGYVSAAMAPGRAQYETGTLQQAQQERMAQEAQQRHQWEQNAPLAQWAQYTGAYGDQFGRPTGPGGYAQIAASSERPDDGGFSWGDVGTSVLGAGLNLGGAYLGGPGGAALTNSMFSAATQPQQPGMPVSNYGGAPAAPGGYGTAPWLRSAGGWGY